MTHDKPQNEELPIAKDSPIEELVYRRDLATLTPAEQEKAIARVDEIKALLELGNKRTEADVVAAAKRLGLSRTWVYKLMNRYHSDGALSAMLGEKRGVRAGTSRIDPAVEKIIWDAIDEFYLTRKKNRAFYIIREVQSSATNMALNGLQKGLYANASNPSLPEKLMQRVKAAITRGTNTAKSLKVFQCQSSR